MHEGEDAFLQLKLVLVSLYAKSAFICVLDGKQSELGTRRDNYAVHISLTVGITYNCQIMGPSERCFVGLFSSFVRILLSNLTVYYST